jgi:hypothetical protein
MNNTKYNYPPITTEEIITLKGVPMSKRIRFINKSAESSKSMEEWVYYSDKDNTKEYYLFKSGKVIGYKKEVF